MVMNISQQRTTSVGPRWVPGSKGVPQSLSVIPDCRNLWELKSLTDLAELCPRERIFSLTLLFHEFHYRNTSIPTTVPNMSFQRVWGGVSQNVLGSNHPSPPIVSWSTTDEEVVTLSVPLPPILPNHFRGLRWRCGICLYQCCSWEADFSQLSSGVSQAEGLSDKCSQLILEILPQLSDRKKN